MPIKILRLVLGGNMKKSITSSLLATSGLLFSLAANAQTIPFNNNAINNDLHGDFEAMVTYAQNVTMPHQNNLFDPRPHLTALRDTLLLVQPVANVSHAGIQVIARDINNQVLGQLSLNTPEQLPAHDGPNTDIIYADNMWSVTLPANWVQPGLTLELVSGETSGQLIDLEIGAPNELMINTLDLGMLTAPLGKFEFMKDTQYHQDYFQKIPVSKLIVNPYGSMQLNEVMLPSGKLLTNYDPSTGGWHTGDMRQHIAKVLIAHGINNANYGINSSAPNESNHSFSVAQLTAVTPVGRYSNGIQVHGGSGGNGMVTLTNTLGNEWSHEVGHNFGLGHYPGGTDGSTHRPATDINSAWGWDQHQQRFIANFMWNKRNGADQVCCSDGIGIPAFEGYKFNRDAMAGGEPTSPISKYTLHTPYMLSHIQGFLESKAVFDSSSSTGLKKWNPSTKTMEEFEQPAIVNSKPLGTQAQLNTIKGDTSGQALASLINSYGRINITTSDGNWIRDIYLPDASMVLPNKIVSVGRYSGYGINLHVNGQSIAFNRNQVQYYVSNGSTWLATSEAELNKQLVTRTPTDSGVPVTTLLGYYDPQQTLTSYLFPALHAPYGLTYAPTPVAELDTNSCYVKVYNRNASVANYQLTGFRYSDNLMNKLHINIKQADDPTKAEVICNNSVKASLNIAKPTEDLKVSIIQSDALTSQQPDDNHAPIANAGTDQTVDAGTTITLSGEQSTDIDGDNLSYKWTQVAGKPIVLQSANKAVTKVSLPDSAEIETYTFKLTVSDGKTLATDTVTITANPNQTANHLPEVSLPASFTGEPKQTIDIKAIASDKDGDALSFLWNTGGLSYQLIASDTIRVILPEVTKDTNYTVSVTVFDSQGASVSTSTTVKVEAPIVTGNCEQTDPNAANYATWSASATYVTGNMVNFNNLVWKSKYWNRGEQPNTSNSWELISNVSLTWSSQLAYSGGDIVIYNGDKYKAKWWTRGDTPDASSVWVNQGSACQ